MNDRECVALLQWALPRLGLRWHGFTNVRRQVCRRVSARAAALGLPDAAAYKRRLEDDPSELAALDALCFVTISRFYRDRRTFDLLRHELLPALAEEALARGETVLRAWSAGCASGEEPYTLSIVWHTELAARFPSLSLEILATDFDQEVLARARRAVFSPSSLRELPEELQRAALENGAVRAPFRSGIDFVHADIRRFAPTAWQNLVFCRNVAFTYFAEDAQRAFAERAAQCLLPGGLLIIGGHETLPPGTPDFQPCAASPHVFIRAR
jgi:chemotaxis protein methyltransferase CheR